MSKWTGVALWLLVGSATSSSVATAGGLENWQYWGGSANTANLAIIAGPADFTGDGKLDTAVYQESTRKIWIGRNTGSSFRFCSQTATDCLPSGSEAWATLNAPGCNINGQPAKYQLHGGQFTSDALPDIAIYNPCNGTIKTLVNNGTSFSAPGNPSVSVSPASGWTMVAGEFANWSPPNARDDLVVYQPTGGGIFVGTNKGTSAGSDFAWTAWAYLEPSLCDADPQVSCSPGTFKPWQLYPDDFDGDGKRDLLLYRPGPKGCAPAPCTPDMNVRVARNANTYFALENWRDLDSAGWKPVVGHFAATTTADLGVLYASGKFDVMRNAQGGFYDDGTWTTLDPAVLSWSLLAGDFLPSDPGQVGGIQDLAAYYPPTGTFWMARNDGSSPEGYAWPLSGAPGQSIDFSISGSLDNTATYNVEIRRVEANASGDLVLVAPGGPEQDQKVATVHRPVLANGKPWENGPAWPVNLSLTIPSTWTSGIYVATLRGVQVQGVLQSSQIVFVVKPGSSKKSTALIANINTWNAYNAWGGESKYKGHVTTTTFLRPNPAAAISVDGSWDFPKSHLAHSEALTLGVLDKIVKAELSSTQGIDVYTDLDFDDAAGGDELDPLIYDRWVLSVHPEYWTTRMYDRLKSVIDNGRDVLYLGGNGVFEDVSYEPTGVPLPTKVVFALDSQRASKLFRVENHGNPAEYRPERALLGVATHACGEPSQPYWIAAQPASGTPRQLYDAVLAGTGLSQNSVIGDTGKLCDVINMVLVCKKASGHEIDVVGHLTDPPCGIALPVQESPDTTPADLVLIATKPVAATFGSDMTIYRKAGTTGVVFSVGSIDFGQSLVVDPALKKIVGNVIKNL